MKKMFFVLLTAVILMVTALLVFSDQNGTDKWCNTDDYGCWVTDENGGKSYIYFWSEEARKYIMGDGSEPGSHVVSLYPGDPDYGEGKLPLMDPPVYDYYYTTAIGTVQDTYTSLSESYVPLTSISYDTTASTVLDYALYSGSTSFTSNELTVYYVTITDPFANSTTSVISYNDQFQSYMSDLRSGGANITWSSAFTMSIEPRSTSYGSFSLSVPVTSFNTGNASRYQTVGKTTAALPIPITNSTTLTTGTSTITNTSCIPTVKTVTSAVLTSSIH